MTPLQMIGKRNRTHRVLNQIDLFDKRNCANCKYSYAGYATGIMFCMMSRKPKVVSQHTLCDLHITKDKQCPIKPTNGSPVIGSSSKG